jgi:hypothetical protein
MVKMKKASAKQKKKKSKASTKKGWENYEQVAAFLLDRFAKDFGVGRFEGKQIVPGDSGTEWEIDAKGCSEDGSHFLLVECKRHTKARINQAITASAAWEIKDTGATGGIIVSACGLQKGAKKVAKSANIVEVVLKPGSTTTDYLLTFLNKVCLGISDTAQVIITESLTIQISDENGNTVETRKIV